MFRRFLSALVIVGLIAVVGAVAWLRPASTPAVRGKQVAVRMGCFACHGEGALGGVPNPGSRDPEMPAWDGGTAMMYVESEAEIREWILLGSPLRLQGHVEPGLVEMPAYEGRLSNAELDDLVAYYQAVAAYEEKPPDQAVREGRRVAFRSGCFGCHGPGGRGASPNPGSFKGVIPAWDGADFADLVRDDDELRSWILNGEVSRLREHAIASRFLDRQVIQMPAYRDLLSDDEVTAIVAYIHWLRREPAS